MNGDFNGPSQPQRTTAVSTLVLQKQRAAQSPQPENFVRNGKAVGSSKATPDLVADEAFTGSAPVATKAKPFFLYVCFHEPHEPVPRPYAALYPPPTPHRAPWQHYAVERRLWPADVPANRACGVAVFFTSDNGPAITPMHPQGSTGPLRDKKGSLWEGGIRVPGILRWPGKTKPGSVSDEPVCGVDFLPTICAATGIQPPRDRKLDGASFLPVLEQKPVARTTPLYWHFNKAAGEPKVALRAGDWRILATLDKPPAQRTNDLTDEEERDFKAAELTGFALYNLRADIAETTDLAASERRSWPTEGAVAAIS